MIPESALPRRPASPKGLVSVSKTWSMSDFRNENGTYNGVAALAAITGIDPAEVEWTAKRIQALTKAGVPKPYILAIVKAERKNKPWN